jgi:hypothetical protein
VTWINSDSSVQSSDDSAFAVASLSVCLLEIGNKKSILKKGPLIDEVDPGAGLFLWPFPHEIRKNPPTLRRDNRDSAPNGTNTSALDSQKQWSQITSTEKGHQNARSRSGEGDAARHSPGRAPRAAARVAEAAPESTMELRP